jgi:hypothetical protein
VNAEQAKAMNATNLEPVGPAKTPTQMEVPLVVHVPLTQIVVILAHNATLNSRAQENPLGFLVATVSFQLVMRPVAHQALAARQSLRVARALVSLTVPLRATAVTPKAMAATQ